MRYKNVFRDKLLIHIQGLTTETVLWADLKELGSPRQISRALNDLMNDGVLVRIGRGIYAKAECSPYLNVPVLRKAFELVCLELLKRMHVRWELGQHIKNYNTGVTQQVPVRFELRLKSRFRRQIVCGKNRLYFEDEINAK